MMRMPYTQILTLTDPGATWSASLGLAVDKTAEGMGIRTARYAIILEDLVVKFVDVRLSLLFTFIETRLSWQVEVQRGVSVSSADNVLAHL
jgi:peroxiredoxin